MSYIIWTIQWWAGKCLQSALKPGGIMKIGLYSELARQDIVKVSKKSVMRVLDLAMQK